ncbi:hypothetical protein B0O99DRAFT_745208 [Bisporella sp. PMI_857]|nr:hypothetical protein B0O99DRAFT_745208 [Bisporella sp. PMI_857]
MSCKRDEWTRRGSYKSMVVAVVMSDADDVITKTASLQNWPIEEQCQEQPDHSHRLCRGPDTCVETGEKRTRAGSASSLILEAVKRAKIKEDFEETIICDTDMSETATGSTQTMEQTMRLRAQEEHPETSGEYINTIVQWEISKTSEPSFIAQSTQGIVVGTLCANGRRESAATDGGASSTGIDTSPSTSRAKQNKNVANNPSTSSATAIVTRSLRKERADADLATAVYQPPYTRQSKNNKGKSKGPTTRENGHSGEAASPATKQADTTLNARSPLGRSLRILNGITSQTPSQIEASPSESPKPTTPAGREGGKQAVMEALRARREAVMKEVKALDEEEQVLGSQERQLREELEKLDVGIAEKKNGKEAWENALRYC